MKCYFVRHGKTQWNLEGRFQGANGDSPLLKESIHDLEKLGDYLQDISFDAVFSSDLKRAKDTCQIIMSRNQHPQTITFEPALREWHLGKLEGNKIATISAIYPHQMQAFRHNLAKFNNSIFEAESVYQTTKRVSSFVKFLKDKPYQNVLLVGHGANFTASIRTLLGYEPAVLRAKGGLDNGSLTILETEDFEHFSCLKWNDTSYK
ncbi:histidine phosphatase family protein [Streptococcus alactolyticus]|jgi:broad specificity phosphatase PhoE|uniref:Histidine phosphatase family protein n=2 Tax=Streptococcus TaxID=1301 RepID=A0A6N7X047_STRAY|nr:MULTISPECIES: histidine phosphatase family protein [Streptococcus]MDE2586685.1 histidine phosphatase family protein [Lactobacillales bacterium]NKN84914.1 histidine phosphatase family protein [Streptococcus agalactiae]HIZ68074.1 histidine phosphatase family protein [Candidatus Streptococcus faecavium]MBD9119679.1 histidine phosphatase family protein [Streptococcus sp.]MCF2666858.1 histidine phosphatase family protein [Streptococcus alactolyticus]